LAAGAAPKCSTPGRIQPRGDWETINVPAFSSGPRPIADYTVHGPRLLLATNGTVVSRSTDGGCRWSETFEASSATGPVTSGRVTIRSISKPAAATSPILLMAEERIRDVTRPVVFRSTNGGASFSAGDAGLPPVGTPEVLRVAPDAPNVAYLGISQGGDLIDQVYATTDGGTTWTLRSDLGEVSKQQNIAGFEVDPVAEGELWAWGPAGAYHSADGGRTFMAIDDMAGQATGPVDIFRASQGTPSRIAFFRPAPDDLLVSPTGGTQWLSIDTPADVDSIAHGSEPLEMLVSNASGHAYLYLSSANAWVDLQARPGSHDAVVSGAGDAPYYLRTATTIERYVRGSTPEPPPRKGGDDVIVGSIDDLPEIADDPARFEGPRDEIVLKPDASRTLTYSLTLAKSQRPLDLFLLVDTTGTMRPFIDGVKVSLGDVINELGAAGISAHVGLGEYRAYPDHFPPRPGEPNFVYKLKVDLTDNMDALRAGLQALTHDGGGQYDAQLGALEQVATGKGADLDPQDPDDGPSQQNTVGHDVPPGQQPTFRSAAEENGQPLRLVLNVSNEPFGRPNPNRGAIDDVADNGGLQNPQIPSFEEVAAAMNTQGIKQIGLALGNAPGTYSDLAQMAEMTNTVAPAGGVDCDGDGINEVEPDRPLVCGLGGNVGEVKNIASAIVNLVKAIPVKESPELNVLQGADVVAEVTPQSYNGVPLRSGQTLPFRVTYTCTEDQAGQRFPVTLQALGTDGVLGRLSTSVRCASLPEEADLRPPAPTLFVPSLLLPILPPIAPPSAPIPISEISSATSSQAQTQAQAQAQAAAAAQRQHQPQLAFAHQQSSKLELAKEEQYEMSAYNRRDPEMPPSLVFVAAAAAMSFAFAMAMRGKSTARARARRRTY
jgi:hypothetical protein